MGLSVRYPCHLDGCRITAEQAGHLRLLRRHWRNKVNIPCELSWGEEKHMQHTEHSTMVRAWPMRFFVKLMQKRRST